MNTIKVQNLIENLIDHNLSDIKPARKTVLLSLFNRFLVHDFPDENKNLDQVIMELTSVSHT